ncbi:hypothetical protein VTJ04DRAFT_10262 [Mycothermus thermophilus]|uniref:uncharacterized protein n=1 Tax=Humicola insolens TaxID=85995 RepID=UPI00374284C7
MGMRKFWKRLSGSHHGASPTPCATPSTAAQSFHLDRANDGFKYARPSACSPGAAITSKTPPPVLSAEPAPEPRPTKFPESPLPVISKSEQLWNAAYDRLERDDRELVESYVKCLETILGGNSGAATDTDLLTELHDPVKRQMYMRRFVEEGRAKIAKASKIMSGVGDMLQKPGQATKSNLAGIAHVISRMDWYCALTDHLLNKDNIAAGEDFRTVMKSICSYYRNQGFVFLRSMLNLDDWDGDMKLVTNAEAAIQNDVGQLFQEQTKTSLRALLKQSEEMNHRLGDIHRDIQEFISLQKDVRRDAIEASCRRDLRVVDPQDDMDRIEKSKDELLDDAYNWILRTQEYAEFTNWDDGESGHPSRRLLWIRGHAGTGKTMLMIGLIRKLSSQPAALSPGISFFFCQDTDAALNTATAVLRSLFWLLLLQQPQLISHLLQKYRESGASLFTDKNAFIALSKAFRNTLMDPQLSPVYLAIDALDECREGRSELIELILTSLTLSSKVKWLVSGRPEVDLRAALKGRDTTSLDASSVLVELDTQRLEAPVNAYINHKLSMLRYQDGYDDDDILNQVSDEVRTRADNTFLWVALAFKVLETVHGAYAVKRIREMPPRLSELYGHMMTRIEEQDFIEPQDCKTVLVITFAAFRPLSILELSALLGMPLGTAKKAIEMCGSFVTSTDGTVNLIHQSAKDYLERNFHRLELTEPSQAHSEILKRSIDAMSAIRWLQYDTHVSSGPTISAP